MPVEQEWEARLTFRPSETLDTRSLSRFLGFASDKMLERFADDEGQSLAEVGRLHEVRCRTTFDPQTLRPIYTLTLVRRQEVMEG